MSDTATSTPSPLDDSSVDQSTQPRHSWFSRLYTGTGAFEIVGRRRFYYVLTGVHLIHVLIGLIVLGVIVRELRNPSRRRASVVEASAVYWHMVDLLWVIIFGLLYVMR